MTSQVPVSEPRSQVSPHLPFQDPVGQAAIGIKSKMLEFVLLIIIGFKLKTSEQSLL